MGLRATLKKLEKCAGDCINCDHMTFHTGNHGRSIYYAVGCDLAPDFDPISERPSALRAELIEQLKFEIAQGVRA